MAPSDSSSTREPVREGLFAGSLDDLGTVRLAGTACGMCDEVQLGSAALCPACGSADVHPRPLARQGTLWTYTVVRHRPPGDYKGQTDFTILPLGLVELDDGLRVLSPITTTEVSDLVIGMPLELRVEPLFVDSAGTERIAFSFAPTAARSA
jgi:uncharacterized OB-fold protein